MRVRVIVGNIEQKLSAFLLRPGSPEAICRLARAFADCRCVKTHFKNAVGCLAGSRAHSFTRDHLGSRSDRGLMPRGKAVRRTKAARQERILTIPLCPFASRVHFRGRVGSDDG